MNCHLASLFFVLIPIFSTYSQDQPTPKETNPIAFLEVLSGYAGGNAKGFIAGASLNYQRKRDVLTFRYRTQFLDKANVPFVFFSIIGFIGSDHIIETSLLYEKGYLINDRSAFSISTGISSNTIKLKENTVLIEDSRSYIGFPSSLILNGLSLKRNALEQFLA